MDRLRKAHKEEGKILVEEREERHKRQAAKNRKRRTKGKNVRWSNENSNVEDPIPLNVMASATSQIQRMKAAAALG